MSEQVLLVRDLSVAYQRTLALRSVDATIWSGRITALLGPNGAGKSTLLKACVELLPRLSGSVTFFDQPLAKVRGRIAYMPQAAEVDWDFPATVRDVVTMGRTCRLRWWQRPNLADRRRVNEALERLGIADLAGRQISELSGGQRQRTFVARVLAQDCELLLLDEPLAGVDIASEHTILAILRELRAEGRTVVLVHHDLTGIKALADDAVLLAAGRVQAAGPVGKCLTPAKIGHAYGLDAVTESPAC